MTAADSGAPPTGAEPAVCPNEAVCEASWEDCACSPDDCTACFPAPRDVGLVGEVPTVELVADTAEATRDFDCCGPAAASPGTPVVVVAEPRIAARCGRISELEAALAARDGEVRQIREDLRRANADGHAVESTTRCGKCGEYNRISRDMCQGCGVPVGAVSAADEKWCSIHGAYRCDHGQGAS